MIWKDNWVVNCTAEMSESYMSLQLRRFTFTENEDAGYSNVMFDISRIPVVFP